MTLGAMAGEKQGVKQALRTRMKRTVAGYRMPLERNIANSCALRIEDNSQASLGKD